MKGISSNESMFQVKPFHGNKQYIPVFWSQFWALCSAKGCAKALSLTIMTKLPASDAATIDVTTATGKACKKAKAQNALPMSYLMLAIDSSKSKLLKMVKASKSTTWPGGLACELVKRMKKKYR